MGDAFVGDASGVPLDQVVRPQPVARQVVLIKRLDGVHRGILFPAFDHAGRVASEDLTLKSPVRLHIACGRASLRDGLPSKATGRMPPRLVAGKGSNMRT
jgi:hypothetical protein